MAEIRYGKREGPVGGKEYPVGASQRFQRRGGHFVTKVDGYIYLAASNMRGAGLLGWAETPKDDSGYNYWQSSSTRGADSVFVHTALDNVYELPWYGTRGASLVATTLLGRGCDLICTPLTTDYQAAMIGKVASPIVIVDVDVDNKTVFVKIKPSSKIA